MRLKRSTVGRMGRRGGALALAAVMLTACGDWRGVANVPIPGGPGTGRDRLTIIVQMPDTLALNVNSRVRVADVFVGSVRSIELKNWVATLTLDLQPNIKLPVGTKAAIGQTSLLGTQHVQLDPPPPPPPPAKAPPPCGSPGGPACLQNNATIPLRDSSAFPSTERVLASVATVLRGGGIPNLEVIQTELNNILDGRAEQIRDFLGKLDTFTDELNQQREDITRAIDATDRLLDIVAERNETLDRVLTEFPPLIKYFAEQRDLFADAVTAVGRFSEVADQVLSDMRADFDTNLQLLQRPLRELGKASPYLIGALKLLLTAPFNIDNVPKVIRGDYINASATFDLTLSALDNALLTGTGFSGALRALEQAWGRDPDTMIPDVRYAPNPADAPVERGE